jgi:hypothetical protein
MALESFGSFVSAGVAAVKAAEGDKDEPTELEAAELVSYFLL